MKGRQVAILDFRKQVGKGSWSRTIVAVKTQEDVIPGKSFDLEVTQAGNWKLLYYPAELLNSSKLMEPAEVEEILRGTERV